MKRRCCLEPDSIAVFVSDVKVSDMPDETCDHLQALFERLAKSKFRSRFKLGSRERAYLEQKGLKVIAQHARDFVTERLGPAQPHNDGKQTPMRNHPVFIAQHATATCCRKCLQKWYRIEMGKALTGDQIEYVVSVICRWLQKNEIR